MGDTRSLRSILDAMIAHALRCSLGLLSVSVKQARDSLAEIGRIFCE